MKPQHAINALLFVAITVALLPATTAAGSIVFTLEEVGPDVVLSYTGMLNDVDNFSINGSGHTYSGYLRSTSGFAAGGGFFFTATEYALTLTGPDAIGSLATSTDADIHNGDYFGLDFGTFGDGLIVPDAYVLGESMSGSSTFNNTTIAGLGVDTPPTSYVWSLGNTAGDTITLNIVPEPTSLALLGLGGLLVARRRASVRPANSCRYSRMKNDRP